MKQTRKPATSGATPIRVVLPIGHHNYGERGEEWFYDITEAEAFVRENWVEGRELSARVQSGGVYETIFGITADGTIFVAPDYDRLIARATRVLGNIKETR